MSSINVKDENSNEALPICLQATKKDFENIDFEFPIKDSISASSDDLASIFTEHANLHHDLSDEYAQPAARVFSMLAAITGLLFEPQYRNEPFKPIMIMEGRRSAIPEDFRGQPLEILSEIASDIKHPVLKARICDVCWLLNRKLHHLGERAVESYLTIVERVIDGNLIDNVNEGTHPICNGAIEDNILRALMIASTLAGKKENELYKKAKDKLRELCDISITHGEPNTVSRFFDMNLDFSVSDLDEVINQLKEYIQTMPGNEYMELRNKIHLFGILIRASKYAKRDNEAYECKLATAKCYEKIADLTTMSMLKAAHLTDALNELINIPNHYRLHIEYRENLEIKLKQAQKNSLGDFVTHSHTTDITTIVTNVKEELEKRENLFELLSFLAHSFNSPEPEELERQAQETQNYSFFSKLFSPTYIDKDGKTKFQSNTDDLRSTISQNEQYRRQLVVQSIIQPTLNHLSENYYIGEDAVIGLLKHSCFVPSEHLYTYSKGIKGFLKGDMITAIYTLVPMLEASLRHILVLNGVSVTRKIEGTQAEENRTISSLFDNKRDELETIFGKAIIADIDHVFLSKPGSTIRHDVVHGFFSDNECYSNDAIYGCWLIFKSCCLFIHKN